ncbi:uncharacterized protein [Diadema antillarum]|uniref:uncharacterized protein n=1 Tax=Diadema antillarum TaxID=105358 RepID=UPI003A8A2812
MEHICWISALLCTLTVIQNAQAGFNVQPTSKEGIQGETVVLRCQIQNEQGAIVVWDRNGLQLSIDSTLVETLDAEFSERFSVIGNHTQGEFNLQINDVKRSDEGEFRCSYISRSGGAFSGVATLTVLIPPSAGFPRCQVLAETPQNSKSTFWPGDVATLRCESAGGDPAANLTWFRSNWTVTASTKHTNVYKRILTRGDNGVTFVCEATSPALREPRRCSVTPMRIPPEVHVRAQSSSVLVGTNATFHCEVNAITRVLEHNWFIDGDLLTSETPGIAFGSSGKVLVIVNAQVEHGSKTVECQAVIENNLEARASSRVVVIPPKKTEPPPSTPTQKVTIIEIDNPEPPSTFRPFITADMNLIIVVVSGSLIVLLLLIAIIMGCWVFGFRKPRRPNTRVNIDYGEVPADMPLDGISHYSVPAAMFSTEVPDTRGPALIHPSSNMDENASGYISALYATLDKNKRQQGKLTSATALPEKPVAQITPTASRNPPMQYDTAATLEKRKSTGAIAYSDLKNTEEEDPALLKGGCNCDCKGTDYEKEDPDTEQ